MSAGWRASLGAVAWVAATAASASGVMHEAWMHALLLFAALVLVPLVQELAAEEACAGAHRELSRWSARLQLPSALSLLVAYRLPPGWRALLAALPWIAVTVLIAAAGLLRLAGRKD